MMRAIFQGMIFFLCSSFLAALPARSERMDFDHDGVSDITYVKLRDTGELQWRYRSSRLRRSRSLGSLGTAGNHLVVGNWDNDKTPEIGVIAGDPDTKKIVWFLEKRNGTPTSFTFGKISELAISGGDFDGNGLLDAAVIELKGGLYYWKLLLNPLGQSANVNTQFGESGDTPFFFKGDGANDRIAVLRKSSDGTATVFMKDVMTNAESSMTLNRKLGNNDTPLGISKGSKNFLVIPEKMDEKTKVSLFRTDGRVFRTFSVRGTGDLIVGNFISRQTGIEIAVKNDEVFSVYNPFTKVLVPLPLNAPVPVDDININALGTWGGNSGGGGGGGACAAKNPNDGYKTGFTWKPNSDTMYYAVAVIPAAYTGRISHTYALRSDGTTVIKEIGLKNCGNPDPAGPRCNYQDRALTGADYKRLYGAIVLKLDLTDGSCITYSIADPSKRTD